MARITVAGGLVLLALFTGFVPAASACKGGNRPPNEQRVDTARSVIVCLVNRERRQHHLHMVHADTALRTAAQAHSDAMAAQNFFDHTGVDGTPASRAHWAGYAKGARAWGIGENLGFGTGALGSPRSIFRGWMRSPGHRQVILERSWRHVGVGVALGSPMGVDGGGMGTYTIDFGFRRG
jgi:uncharacterized protein YkwD